MGWWSATVMGGDTPLDEQAGICRVAGVPWGPDTLDNWEPAHEFEGGDLHLWLVRREHIEENLGAIVEHLEGLSNAYCNQRIAVQVFGAMVLWTGAAIPDELRERIIRSAEDDEWAAEGDVERVRHMADFIAALRNHKSGVRHELTEDGLMSQLDKLVTGECDCNGECDDKYGAGEAR